MSWFCRRYGAAKDAYAHIQNKTPKRRSSYIACLIQVIHRDKDLRIIYFCPTAQSTKQDRGLGAPGFRVFESVFKHAVMQKAGQDVLEDKSSLPNESRALNFHEACAEAIQELEKLSGSEDRCLQIADACQVMQASYTHHISTIAIEVYNQIMSPEQKASSYETLLPRGHAHMHCLHLKHRS